ncbi:MAG: FCD domain-containing protein [Candidatus Obscuribacterales bacterium]|nr:FCD domain-containing protein [Candidatus Obscuribacterales bacterium]
MDKQRKPTKATVVLERLQEDILSGKLAPEEKLQIEVLKKRYGLSGSPLREALSRLVVNGLVKVEEQCGFCVAPLSLDELLDIYEIRAKIESMAIEMAIANGDDSWEADILASWHRFSKYIDPKINKNVDPVKWDELQKDFLYSLVKACGSPWLLKIRDMLYDQTARYRVVCINAHYKDEKVLAHLLRDDEKLVAAVLARDAKNACKISEEGYRTSVSYIAEALKKRMPPGIQHSEPKHEQREEKRRKRS